MTIQRSVFVFMISCCVCASSEASQNVFADHALSEPFPESQPKPASLDSEVVTAAQEFPSPEPKPSVPVVKQDPKKTIFKFPGQDWKNRTAKDYGFPFYRMQVQPKWENSTPKPWSALGASYTQYAAFIIDHFGSHLLNGPHEFTRRNNICPKYNTLSRSQKIEFWVHFTSALVKPESGYKPTDRMRESTFGKPDSVTKEQVYSEGLLQLSYQDMKSYPNECGGVFDWERDSRISRTSEQKTIFDPMRNLYCGLRILDRTVAKKQAVFFDDNNYWAVLKPNGKYGKVPAISREVHAQTPFCR